MTVESEQPHRVVDAITQFRRVEQQRADEYVAEQLQRQIGLRLIGPGQRLPPERELARLFGVGRATVQRAIKLLQEDGIIESRRGRRGGNFVRASAAPARGSERLLEDLRQERAPIEQALTFRLEIEPAAAALAAEGASEEEIASIAAAAAEIDPALPDPRFDRLDAEFHLTIARATHNEFFVDAIERVRVQIGAALRAMPESQRWHERSIREHAAIVDALRRRDARAARARMRTHLAHTDQGVRALIVAL
jgi:GntR family transcriptional regulator, transcriptional repressor for pyruvate dehydrogenase complex